MSKNQELERLTPMPFKNRDIKFKAKPKFPQDIGGQEAREEYREGYQKKGPK